jgi:hypothetical protein
MAKEVFKEDQRFTQWWIWIILLGVLAYEIKLTIDLIQMEDVDGRSLSAYLLIMLPILLVLALFAFSKLYTRIDETGIEVVFKPFSFSRRRFKWDEIVQANSITYSPIKDFGGWGYRISLRGKGTAMNVKGNKGIELKLNNGKSFTIGTQKPEEAMRAINSYLRTSETKS